MDIGFEPRLEPEEYEAPRCPVCDAETEILYRRFDGEIVGCENCICGVDAFEWEEERCIAI